MMRRLLDDGQKNDRDNLRKVLGKLSREERLVCIWKRAGFSSQEIAHHNARTVASVDGLFARAKEKLRKLLREGKAKYSRDQSAIKKVTTRSRRAKKQRKQIK